MWRRAYCGGCSAAFLGGSRVGMRMRTQSRLYIYIYIYIFVHICFLLFTIDIHLTMISPHALLHSPENEARHAICVYALVYADLSATVRGLQTACTRVDAWDRLDAL